MSEIPKAIQPRKTAWLRAALAITGFALVILGCKFALIHFASSDLPIDDQWDAEGAVTLQPWLEHRWGIRELIHPHNEHRLITTKLYVLALFALNSQWDAIVEMVCNAVVHTSCAVFLLLISRRWLQGGSWAAFGGLVVLLFSLPYNWENTLGGFQIQFYLLLLFSGAHIVLTLESDRISRGWILGQFAGILAVATQASGFFSAMAVSAVLTLRLFRQRRLTAQQWTTVCFCVVLVAAGWAGKYSVPGHEALKAHTVGEFLSAILRQLCWPGVHFFPWSLVLAIPGVVFFLQSLRRASLSSGEYVRLALGSWVFLQIIAIAYSRANADPVAPRYLDLLALGVALNFVFLLASARGRGRFAWVALWSGVVVFCLGEQSLTAWRDAIVPGAATARKREENVRAYLASGDSSGLSQHPSNELPYPNPGILLSRLKNPSLAGILPASVRRSLPLAPESGSTFEQIPPTLPLPSGPIAVSSWTSQSNRPAFEWRSAPSTAPTLPILRFRVVGQAAEDSAALQVLIKSDSGSIALPLGSLAPNHWKTLHIERPIGSWWLQVIDRDPVGWCAVTEPVEVGRLSWLAGKIIKASVWLVLLGLGLLAVVGLWSAPRRSMS